MDKKKCRKRGKSTRRCGEAINLLCWILQSVEEPLELGKVTRNCNIQSINHSINQSINQSIIHSFIHSINGPMDRSINQRIAVNQSRSINQSTDRWNDQWNDERSKRLIGAPSIPFPFAGLPCYKNQNRRNRFTAPSGSTCEAETASVSARRCLHRCAICSIRALGSTSGVPYVEHVHCIL